MIQPCTGCGRLVLLHRIANLVVKADPAPLTDVGDILKLIAGPNPPSLWAVERNQWDVPTRLRGARPGEKPVVPEHRCIRVGGSTSPPVASPRPVAAPQASPGLSEAESVLGGPSRPGDASSAPFDQPLRPHPCDACSKPVILGGPEEYAAIELGATAVWAVHSPCAPV
jgi:hypothetical protein